MDEPIPDLPACGSCTRGRIVLFTSARPCDRCLGTGLDLTDARLSSAAVADLPTLVRTRKYLHRIGVRTLSDVLRFAAAGGLENLEAEGSPSVAEDIRRLLGGRGLPTPPQPAP